MAGSGVAARALGVPGLTQSAGGIQGLSMTGVSPTAQNVHSSRLPSTTAVAGPSAGRRPTLPQPLLPSQASEWKASAKGMTVSTVRHIGMQEIWPFTRLPAFSDIVRNLYLPPSITSWQQVVRAAVLFTGTVEKWEPARRPDDSCGTHAQNLDYPSGDDWIRYWLDLQPLSRFDRPLEDITDPHTLLKPTSQPEDWLLFWIRTRTVVMGTLFGLKASSPYSTSNSQINVLPPDRWNAWVGDVTWVLHELLRQ
ncbi:hypothetical protein C8T65DRAFT_746109 [Cerioporus squamosus]|nr:hypothetical protein C8T65DRAFT_746109 [Cerioporus squamosus]